MHSGVCTKINIATVKLLQYNAVWPKICIPFVHLQGHIYLNLDFSCDLFATNLSIWI